MKQTLYYLGLITLLTWTCLSPTVQGQEKKPNDFLSILKMGQSIVLKETGGRYEITLIEGTHKIIEVGPDYIVVEDIAGIVEERIPIYSIKTFPKLNSPFYPNENDSLSNPML